MESIYWLVAGFVSSLILIMFAQGKPERIQTNIFGIALVIAAFVYVGFALLFAGSIWLLIELLGVLVYGGFYFFSIRYGLKVLIYGWLLHPVWDVSLHLIGVGSEFAPGWYATMCISFDLTVAAYLIWLQRRTYRFS